MPVSFLDLPPELRNSVYTLLFVVSYPISMYYRRPGISTKLFLVSKTIHREATFVFYSQNSFGFEISGNSGEGFFNRIGPHNAASIRHVCILMPQFVCRNLVTITLDTDSAAIIKTLYRYCVNLSILTLRRVWLYRSINDRNFRDAKSSDHHQMLGFVQSMIHDRLGPVQIRIVANKRYYDDEMKREIARVGIKLVET